METVASKVPFYQLCVLLDKISNKSGTDAKKQLLKEFIGEWRSFHSKLHDSKTEAVTDSFYPVMRLLLPQLERERQAYGIKEHLLAKHYIDIMGLGKDSPAAQKLLNYRAPKSAKADAGDFASVCYWILKPRCPEKGNMTIEEVNRCLDEISVGHAAKDKPTVKRSLQCMLRCMSAREQKWLIRMMMKEMKMGISQQSVFSVYHQDAEDLFNVKMSLEKVCLMLSNPSVRLHEVEISIFSPFRPMLGDRSAPNKVEKIMDNKAFFMETKFDGERMQLHKKGEEFKYYTRSGNDYTHTFGNTAYNGTLTPSIINCFKDGVNECILDGEMCGYDPLTETIGSKGENFDIKSKEQDKYQPMLCVFDILLLNDEVLTNKSLRERKAIMKTVLDPIQGRIIFSEHKEGKTKQNCVDALNEAIDDREEGIMVKDPESTYRPNTRKGGWYKLKPEYIGGLMDELDLLVVGGYLGLGSRSNLMSHFLCAVAVPPEGGEKPRVFHSFCRVGSGYSRKELYDFNEKLKNNWKPLSKKSGPSWLFLAPGMKRPDAYIEPDKSFIVQIKAAEIIDSDQYKTECTLRFPRVEKIRYDKPWYDCLTTTELTDLRQKSSGKLTGGHVEVNEDDDEPTKKRRKVVSRHVKPTVMANFRGVDMADVKKVSEILEGKEICVMNGPSSYPKASLEKKIIEYGGTIAQNPGLETYCVLADKVGLKVKNIISKGTHDVVKASWLQQSIEKACFIAWKPSDMIHTSSGTAKKFALDYDRHGDSYFSGTTTEKLKLVFDKVEKEGSAENVTAEQITELEMKYFPHDSQQGLFRLCRVHLDLNTVLGQGSTRIKNNSLELAGLQLRYFGATLCKDIDPHLSHIIVALSDINRVQEMRRLNKSRTKKFHIVSSSWVDDCVEAEKILNERHYEPAAS